MNLNFLFAVKSFNYNFISQSGLRRRKLEDGTVVMVMCEDQDTVFDSIIDSLQAG